MRRITAYVGHLLAATLAVPWVTLLASGLVYGILRPFLRSGSSPQQFLSSYVIFLVIVVGASLAYTTSLHFTSSSAIWVWIPAAVVFAYRVFDWRTGGSVFFEPSSFITHFFTANCQFQDWREGGFESRCFDKLFITPLFAGSLSYSAASLIRRFAQDRRPPKDASPGPALPNGLQVVTTPLAAFLALALAGSFLGNQFHAAATAQPDSWLWLGYGVFSRWAVLALNIAVWTAIYLMGIGFARAPLRKDEKVLLVSLVAPLMLIPVGALLPKINGLVHIVQTLLRLTAFLAALAILLSLLRGRLGSSSHQSG